MSYRTNNIEYKYGNTTVTILKPSGTVEGDVMIAALLSNDSARTLTSAPSGWTLLHDSSQSDSPSVKGWVYWKKAGASEPASYDWVFNYALNGPAGIAVWADCDVVDVSGETEFAAASAGPWTITAPSIETNVNGTTNIWIGALRHTPIGVASTFAPPSGYTERFDAGSSGWAVSLSIADKEQATAGASGAAAGTGTNSGATNGKWWAVHIALKPAVGSYTSRPSSDISAGTWSASAGDDLYAMIDEETPSDADYIEATSAGTCEVKLATITAPPSGWMTNIAYRILGDCTVKLMQGAVEKASWPHTGIASATTFTQTLSSGEQASISSWSDLRLQFIKP